MKQKKILFSIVLFLLSSIIMFAQQIKVKGTVKDDSGANLPGVNVKIKGSSTGTSTGFDGVYEITASKGSVLQYSYLGYSNQERVVSDATLSNVILKSDAKQLEGVVITAFGIKNKSKSLGYATQTINASDVERPGQVNALESLQGSVAGVSINRTSGAAGAGVDILIRGVSSLDGGSNNQPLIVVDGNPINNSTFAGNVIPSTGSSSAGSSEQFSFSNRGIDINPNDIESYTVLKGAGATALYGILAGNGVILITTKKGKEGKTKINISSSTSFNSVNKYPEMQTKWREGRQFGTEPTALIQSIDPNLPTGYSFTPYSIANPGFTPFRSWGPEYSATDDKSIKYYDNYRNFFKTGINQVLNVSVSGGNDKINYFISASNSSDKGIAPNTGYDKKTIKFNGGYKISDKFKIGTSVSYANSGAQRANSGDKSIFSSLTYWTPSIDVNTYLTTAGKEINYSDGIVDNPRYYAEKSGMTDTTDRWIASADFDWQAKSWLNFVYRASVDNSSEFRNRFVPADVDLGSQGGFIVNENINFRGLNSNLLAIVNKKFGKISTTLTLGNQISDNKSNYNGLRGELLLIEGFNNITNTTRLYPLTSPGLEVVRNVGYFGELKADINEILYLGFTARQDNVSTLPKANRSFNYYSANGAFAFNELLDKDKSILTYGKLRASWAQVGKVPPFGVTGRYSYPNGNFPFNGVGGVSISAVDGNANIRPEIVTTVEYGADFKFFNNRLRLEYTYFDRKSDDQIIPRPVAPSSSLSLAWSNNGSLQTKGHELTLGFDLIRNTNVKWSTIFNVTAYKSEVLSLPVDNIVFADSGQNVLSEIKVGDSAGAIYGRVWTYIDGRLLIGANGLPVVKVDPTNSSAFASEVVGNAFPDYVATMNNTFKYKNFGLSFLLEYKKGGDVFDAGQRNGIRNGILGITEERNITKVLDGVRFDIPSNSYVTNDIVTKIDQNYFRSENYNYVSETLVQDASWVKLRNVSLSYDLSSSICNKLKISSTTLSVSGNNFLLWTPFRGFDPEGSQFSSGSNVYGFSGLSTPITRSFTFSVNVGF